MFLSEKSMYMISAFLLQKSIYIYLKRNIFVMGVVNFSRHIMYNNNNNNNNNNNKWTTRWRTIEKRDLSFLMRNKNEMAK